MPGRVGLILLAAGGSSRMGEAGPKQLLPYQGKTLVRHAAQICAATRCQPVFVVIGAQAERVRKELEGLKVSVVENARWREGIGSSIRAGVEAAAQIDPGLDALIFALADQPKVKAGHLDALVEAYERDRPGVVASEYGGGAGVPALFDRRLFGELLALTGDAGAKSVIARHRSEAVVLPLPEAEIDVDTPDDIAPL